MQRFVFTVFAVLLLLLPARAEERIVKFISSVTVNADSSIDVVETISVNAEGNQIKRGILRDFPTIYQTKDGENVEIGFDIQSVKRDGRSEQFAREGIANGVRIKIGNRDVLLANGIHTYEIVYRATGELGFFAGYDELYWNVTGNSWTFPIDKAEVLVQLPPGAVIRQHAEYTGVQGASGKDFRVTAGEGATYRAETTRSLAAGEGFTIAVGFTKGIVAAPPPPPPEIDTAKQSFVALGGGIGGLLVYYLVAWFFVGRDPAGRAIIPLFIPPAELGPAGVRFVWKRIFDEKSFASAVIGLAAKGRLRITGNGNYALEKLRNEGPALVATEKALYNGLPTGSIAVKDKNATAIRGLRTTLETSLRRDYGRQTFHGNRGWFWTGLLLSFAALVPAIAYMRTGDFALAAVLTFICGGLWALLLWLIVLNARSFMKKGAVRKIFGLVGFGLLLPFVLMGVAIMGVIISEARDWSMLIYAGGLGIVALLHLIFFHWLSAPTVLGRDLLDQIEGLRLYMTTAEEQRLDMLNPPEKTPALFEKLLPYALALDCENAWSEKFAAVLAAASYVAPSWYAGSDWSTGRLDGFSNDLHSSQYDHTTRTSSSSWSPGSFSGSFGGGSSGGGGGGGGGSGW